MSSVIATLASGCRMRRSGDGDGMLLVPEGVVNLNGSAAAIVELIDGKRSVDEIVAELAQRTGIDRRSMSSDVEELLHRLAAQCWLVLSDRAAVR